MSTVYFHSKEGSAELSGAERAYGSMMCNNLLLASLGIDGTANREKYNKIIPPDCYILRTDSDTRFVEAFRSYTLAAGMFGENHLIMPKTGNSLNASHLALNTAVAMGSDPVRLLAKLHGQCEIHCYVEGPNRAWLADIVEQGMKDNILRTFGKLKGDGWGWHTVIELLRSRDDGPVVCSYSVCDRFPNGHIAAQDEEQHWEDLWYELPEERQWELALQGLRKVNEKWYLEMKPETFAIQGYGNGLSGFDLYRALFEEE
jgi:hypothetical protein